MSRSTRRSAAEASAALAVYVAYSVWLTWPLVLDPKTRIFGARGDLTGGIAILRELIEQRLNPFVPGTIYDFSAPDGRAVDWVLNLLSAPSTAVRYGLGLLFGPVAAMNAFVLFGFVGSALAMFLLVRSLTGDWLVGLVIGWAFGFSPAVVAHARHHPDFVHGWLFVLMAWRVLAVAERPTRRNGLLVSGAVVLAFTWTPYYVLLGGILLAALLAVVGTRAVLAQRWAKLRTYGWCLVGPACVAGLIAAASLLGDSPVREHPPNELYAYSARAFEYVLPDPWNPFTGGLTDSYLSSHRHGSDKAEQSLYLGLTLIALAIVAVALLAWRRRETRARAFERHVTPFLVVVVVAVIFSAPPTTSALGFELTMPSSYVFDVTTAWRAFARFGLLAMLAVCILAAMGLAALAGRSRRRRAAVLVVAAGLIVADLVTVPSRRTNELTAPDVYSQLKSLDDGLVAEYPLAIRPFHGDFNELLFQEAHEKRILNGYRDESPAEARAVALVRIEDPQAAERLALVGVRHVVLRKRSPLSRGARAPRLKRGFRLLAEDTYARLYQVTAPRTGSLIVPTDGFDIDEGGFRWLTSSTGNLEIWAGCASCDGELQFSATSFARDRQLIVSTAETELVRTTVTPRESLVRVPIRFRRRTNVRLTVTPGPEPVADAIPASTDTRSVSVAIGAPRFIPDPPQRPTARARKHGSRGPR